MTRAIGAGNHGAMNDRPPSEGKMPPRRSRGFTRAGGLIGRQMSTVSARRGFVEARLAALWPEIAGAEIASLAVPVKLVTARGPAGGLLTLAVAPARGPEVQMLIPALRDRINAALGPGTVGRIQLTQAVHGFEEPARAYAAEAPAAPPPDLGAMARPLSTIGDDGLRGALETLARNVLSRSRKP